MENDPAIEELYDDLIVLTREGGMLLGQGNLGAGEDPPADPLFTECALADEGARFLAAIHPAE